MRVYTARHVVPVSSPLIQDGAVAVDGETIVDVGPQGAVLARAGEDPEIRDLGDAVVLPGLVNAHTHIELSWMGRERPPGGDYVGWLRAMLDRRGSVDPELARETAEREIRSIVARGTVAVGDVANDTWIVPLLARSPLRGIVFHEIYGMRAADAEKTIENGVARLNEIDESRDLVEAAGRLRFVLTPHGPHTTSVPLLRALAGRAAATRDPLAIHVAESEAEVALLANGGGALAELYREREFLDADWKPAAHTPVEHLQRLNVLTPATLAIHCVRLDRQDHSRLQSSGATVVTCPRSNRYLGVGSSPIPRLLGEGIPVALGTDSLASAPDLDLFAEMAALREEHPALSPAAIVRMATLNGARALGLAEQLGSIESGKLAALAVVGGVDRDADPLAAVLSVPSDAYRLEDAPWTVPA